MERTENTKGVSGRLEKSGIRVWEVCCLAISDMPLPSRGYACGRTDGEVALNACIDESVSSVN